MAERIEEVINTLYEMVQDAWSLPLGNDKCVLERDKVLDLLDEMNNQLPSEFKQAKTIVDARNEIINGAKREAEAILKQAELKAKQQLSEDAVRRRAEAEAEQIIADANAQASRAIESANKRLSDLKAASIRFVVDALSSTEVSIRNSLADVSATRQRLEAMVPSAAMQQEKAAAEVNPSDVQQTEQETEPEASAETDEETEE